MIRFNTAIFHPNYHQAQIGIQVEDLFDPSTNTIRQGILLGRSRPYTLRRIGESRSISTFLPQGNASVIWSEPDQILEMEHGNTLLHARINSIQTEKGVQHFVTQSESYDGSCLVLVRTGLTGPINEKDVQKLSPRFHGVLPLEGISREIASHVHYWRNFSAPESSEGIPVRKLVLYELQEGATLLVGDTIPNRECCLTVEAGVVVRVDAPRCARELLDTHSHELSTLVTDRQTRQGTLVAA
jgi:hypothetical protein